MQPVSDTVVLNDKGKGRAALEQDLYGPAPIVEKRMLQRIGDQIIRNEADRDSLLRSQVNVIGLDLDAGRR